MQNSKEQCNKMMRDGSGRRSQAEEVVECCAVEEEQFKCSDWSFSLDAMCNRRGNIKPNL